LPTEWIRLVETMFYKVNGGGEKRNSIKSIEEEIITTRQNQMRQGKILYKTDLDRGGRGRKPPYISDEKKKKGELKENMRWYVFRHYAKKPVKTQRILEANGMEWSGFGRG